MVSRSRVPPGRLLGAYRTLAHLASTLMRPLWELHAVLIGSSDGDGDDGGRLGALVLTWTKLSPPSQQNTSVLQFGDKMSRTHAAAKPLQQTAVLPWAEHWVICVLVSPPSSPLRARMRELGMAAAVMAAARMVKTVVNCILAVVESGAVEKLMLLFVWWVGG